MNFFPQNKATSWIILILVICIIVISTPIVSDFVHVIGSAIFSIIALASCKFIYLYYANLAAPKETILVHLMKFLMLNTAAVLTHANMFGILFNLFPEAIQISLDSYPNLTCSLTVNELYTVLMCHCFPAILVFKALAIFSPTYYLSMNHDKMWKLTSLSFGGLLLIEYMVILLKYQTLCTRHNIYNMQTLRNLNVNISQMNEKPPTLFLHLAAIFGLRIVIYMLVLLKKRCHVNIMKRILPTTNKITPLEVIHDQTNKHLTLPCTLPKVSNSKVVNPLLSSAAHQTNDPINNKLQINNFIRNRNEDFIEIVTLDTPSDGNGSESDTTKNKVMEDPIQKEEPLDINDTKDIINAANHNNIQNVAVYLKHLLNTDIAIYIGTAALALAIFTVFINSENNSVIIIHLIVVRVFFLALPPYWILRSGEKTIFVIRRLKRFFNL